jgi:oxazoline/thiazoline synthase
MFLEGSQSRNSPTDSTDESEILVLDQTRPDVKMPVVKVIAPGLRHFWARFAPGRLYDVPVQMGWQGRSLAEEELNPIPIFF